MRVVGVDGTGTGRDHGKRKPRDQASGRPRPKCFRAHAEMAAANDAVHLNRHTERAPTGAWPWRLHWRQTREAGGAPISSY